MVFLGYVGKSYRPNAYDEEVIANLFTLDSIPLLKGINRRVDYKVQRNEIESQQSYTGLDLLKEEYSFFTVAQESTKVQG